MTLEVEVIDTQTGRQFRYLTWPDCLLRKTAYVLSLGGIPIPVTIKASRRSTRNGIVGLLVRYVGPNPERPRIYTRWLASNEDQTLFLAPVDGKE